MIEIISIFSQFLIFLVIFSFPFTPKTVASIFNIKFNTISLLDSHCLNIIIFCYFALILSFLNIDLKIIFKIYLLLSLIFIFLNFKNYSSYFKRSEIFLFLTFALLVISIFFSVAQNLKLEWDGHHWLEKTLVFFNNYDIENLKNVQTHPEYPHLSSYLWAFFWKNSFLELEYFGRYFHIYFYVISIFFIFNSLKLKKNLTTISLILFFILITYEPYLLAGYQEYLIFSTLIIATRYISLIEFKKFDNLKLIYLIIFILYLNCWFKDEGAIYFLIFSTILVLLLNVSSISKINFCFLILGLLILQFFLQKYFIGIYDFPQRPSLSGVFSEILNINILLTKLSKILLHCLIAFIKYPLWLIIFICIFFLFKSIKKFDPNTKYLLICLSINMIFIFSIFFTFKSFDFMLKVSLDRLLFQTSGFYIPLFLFLIGNFKLLKK